jgi:hypothetical protein
MASDRAKDALSMRRAGATLQQIGRTLGVGKTRVRQLVLAALQEELVPKVSDGAMLTKLPGPGSANAPDLPARLSQIAQAGK